MSYLPLYNDKINCIKRNLGRIDKEKKLVVSLFSGCGGMDLGLEGDFDVLEASVNHKIHPDWITKKNNSGLVRLRPTGFKTIFANDIVPAAQAAWLLRFGKKGASKGTFHLGSIVDYVKSAKNGGINIFPSYADVVTGGFPCQDFSVAGKRNGFSSHKNHHGLTMESGDDSSFENRGKLYMWMREVIGIVKPRIFIAENVKGLVSLKNVREIIENDFRNIGKEGYLVLSKVLKAQDFGVPQTRERVIFLGFLKSALKKNALKALEKKHVPLDYDPYPPQTHSIYDINMLPPVTTRQALFGLPEPEESDDLSQQNYSRARWYGKHCQGQVEVKLDAPGPTIRSEHHGNIEFRRLSISHGGKNVEELARGLKERRLTVRECARIQTFPDNFKFVQKGIDHDCQISVSGSAAYKLIGNAVPPLLAYHIAKRLEELWPKLFKRR